MGVVFAAQVTQSLAMKMFLDKIRPFRGGVIDMFLFGSRARDDWRPDSDFDILVIVPRREREIVDGLYDAAVDVLLETGSLISLKIFTQTQYDRLAEIPTPFLANVQTEGIRLGLDGEEAY